MSVVMKNSTENISKCIALISKMQKLMQSAWLKISRKRWPNMNTKTQHTPGHTPLPWHIELDLHGYSIWGGRTSREIDRVANLCGDKDFDPIANANAKLIVDAVNIYGELFKAAKAVMDIYYDRQIEDEWLHEPMSKLCDAIAKAEGKE